MESPLQQVLEFHQMFDVPIDHFVPARELISQRKRLIDEEHAEVDAELGKFFFDRGDRALLAKELADLVVVIYGTAVALGIDLDVALERVHASNMSKLGENGKPVKRSDGKVLKGPNYQEPVMDELVTRVVEGSATEHEPRD